MDKISGLILAHAEPAATALAAGFLPTFTALAAATVAAAIAETWVEERHRRPLGAICRRLRQSRDMVAISRETVVELEDDAYRPSM